VASLESVKLKIFRAVEHYNSLIAVAKGYLEAKRGHIVVEVDAKSQTAQIVGASLPVIPPQISLIVGDCLQNLRSSLDYLVWELCLAAKAVPGKNHSFPICETKGCFSQAIRRGCLTGLSENATAEIESFQPYHGGEMKHQTALWVLNELSNINKHRRVLLTKLDCGWVTFDRETGVAHSRYAQAFPATAEGVNVEEDLVTYIAFDEGVAQGLEVSRTLNDIAWEMGENVLPQFERFFD
jgi:hypothetical protein